jgi:hypothetical protein
MYFAFTTLGVPNRLIISLTIAMAASSLSNWSGLNGLVVRISLADAFAGLCGSSVI